MRIDEGAQEMGLQSEIGVAIETYLRTAGLEDEWLGHDVGIFNERRKMDWKCFGSTPNETKLMSKLAEAVRECEVSLAKAAEKIFTAPYDSIDRQPYLAAFKNHSPLAGFPIIPLLRIFPSKKMRPKYLEYKRIVGQANGFEPFLIPLVQAHGIQPKLSGALVLYLKPKAETLRHLPMLKSLVLPLLETHRQRYGLLPSGQENLERLLFDLLISDFGAKSRPFNNGESERAIQRHNIDLRFSQRLAGTGLESCGACEDSERLILSCRKSGCATGAGTKLCDRCTDAYRVVYQHSESGPRKFGCWHIIKELFYCGDEEVNQPREIPIIVAQAFLGLKKSKSKAEIVMPAMPGILALLALRRILTAMEKPAGTSLSVTKGGGGALVIPLSSDEQKKGGRTGLRDRFLMRSSGFSSRSRGETAAELWRAIFLDFSRHRPAYAWSNIDSELDFWLGPRALPIFSMNFYDSALEVCWPGTV